MGDLGIGVRKHFLGYGRGMFRSATPLQPRRTLTRPAVVPVPPPSNVGMSAAADPSIAYGAAADPLQFSTFNDFGGVSSSGPNFVVFTFAAGHVAGTVAVAFSGGGNGTLTVTSTGGGGPWVDSGSGPTGIEVNVDETSGAPFDLTAELSFDDGGTQTLSSGAANLFYV